ncbi:Alkyl hydroperoxide reductase [Candidatus Nitrotoga sp. HW29]|uniref:redoxin domain-containing protein n=1 Tax=Candidatus Nitrotoga sp. HW29 TaxID=2886963 RepID=UPI001EF1FDDD|nr:redoxin domain-containing protein [Candidatus Nitrotoga sp. HW29]CAH1904961.1 Alkyl hydroperoxide reductase [Candidatus Nitrotoga sp. HW29]
MPNINSAAPELQVSQWLNTLRTITLADLRGRVVVLHAFQMLCPGCVSHGLPQAAAIHETFPAADVAVIGIHSVFEHHNAMTPVALEAFLYEYRIRFPVAVDRPSTTGNIPHTMEAFNMRGTPTLIILDRQGRIRLNHFGRMDDLRVGATIGQLISETAIDPNSNQYSEQSITGRIGCDDEKCVISENMEQTNP